ncbi:hypothetical protein [uncultured Dokdonia sp.]|uniref:hypothetical protein n=1 Tax=uncultured Dokdonia sp. TaxID=575653 RepID=UPI00261398EC|nr:hypothetical protein [uncultured Dokdonia sp.]
MKKLLNITYGIAIAFIFPFFGLLITNWLEHGFALALSVIVIPLIGVFFLKSKHKQIGIGIFIGYIPVLVFALSFLVISKLH